MAEPETREGQPKEVKGFVVESGVGKYLTKNRFWYEHDKPEKAMVFTENSVTNTIEASKNQDWDLKPTDVTPATWDGKDVKVVGKKVNVGDFLKKKD